MSAAVLQEAPQAGPGFSLIRQALLTDRWPWILIVLIFGETLAIGAEVAVLTSAGSVNSLSSLQRLLAAFAVVSLARIAFSAAQSVFREMWHVSFVQRILSASAVSASGRPDLYPDRELATSRISAALSNGHMVTANVVQFCCEVLRCALQYVTIALVFCLTLGWQLLLPFCFGVGLTFILAKRFQSISRRYAEITENARIELGSTFSTVWDGVVLGNRSWSLRWFDSFASAFAPFRQASRRQCAMDFGLQMMQAVATYAAFAATAAAIAFGDDASKAILVGLLASLPKFVQLLSLQSQLSQYVISTGFLQGQCAILEQSISVPSRRDLLARVSMESITVQSEQGDSLSVSQLFNDDISWSLKGSRLTIRGSNGSGKTSTLLELKSRLGDSALFVPATAMRAASDTEPGDRSTGQQHIRLLRDALANSREQVLLLDEWDAHLDDAKTLEVEKMIGSVVLAGRCVIETRHGTSP